MRQRRQRQRVRIFFASLVAASGLVFLFHDGNQPSGNPIGLEPLAQARETVASLWNESAQVMHPPALDELVLPQGFHAQWTQANLDKGQISLKSLKQPYSIGQTTNGLGSEYFPYAAFLFEQLAIQVESPQLSDKLHRLSAQAQALGNTLREAGTLRYDGKPSKGMVHLQVRENLLAMLSELNRSGMIQVQYNDKGQLVSQKRLTGQDTAGDSLSSFLSTLQAVLNDPAAKKYPQALQIVRFQSDWLAQVAQHVALRWESTQYCHKQCTQVTYVRVYAQQTLPTQQSPHLLYES